ncbi:6332_t:CDS:2, partial [Gigaspora margarita]
IVISVNNQCFRKKNALDSQLLQKKFKDFTRNTPCKVGDQACIGKDFALCAQEDSWSIIPCNNNLVCVVLPLVLKSGTSITCDTIVDQNLRIHDSFKAAKGC